LHDNFKVTMNYEELLETRDARKTNRIRLPYGYFYKRLLDRKYSNFVEFHDEISDNISIGACIRLECDAIAVIKNKHQLHFTANDCGGDVYALAVEPGNYITFEQLLNDTPAVVARKGFFETTIGDLVALLEELHEQGIYHLCFAPSNVLARKSDASVRLLLHGSPFLQLKIQEAIFDGVEDYTAPEVLSEGMGDERSDVYGLAKFAEWLYGSSGVPYEQKSVIAKATSENPSDRYATIGEFYAALKLRSRLRRSLLAGAAALVVALFVLSLVLDMMPDSAPKEYVQPVEEETTEDVYDDGFDPWVELGPDADSAAIANAVRDYLTNDSGKIDARKMREFEAKAEQIFRKQFTKAADVILSKIYNNERMNNNEKSFMASSEEVMKELVLKQQELSKNSPLSDAKAQRIASEIIEQLTEAKKAAMATTDYGLKPKAKEK